MRFTHPQSDVFVPNALLEPLAAFARVTHLCIVAHQDDIEFNAYAAVADCLDLPGKALGGVVMTNGAGSARTGAYAGVSDEQMQVVRREEQRKAAQLGGYAIAVQLAYPSAEVKKRGHPGVAADLAQIFAACRPEVVYLHNPADKHDTHVAVFLRSLEAIRALPADRRPQRVIGFEAWRDLDWLLDSDKVLLDSGRHPRLAAELAKVFDSQISGGKHYDVAVAGRRVAHASFHMSHAVDQVAGITWAMDLTPLARDSALSVEEYVSNQVERFRADVIHRVRSFS
jgi:LmbE family N-acetylglucosaminyl deacetylase